VTPDIARTSAPATIATHRSDGMRSRCSHLRTAGTVTSLPASDAKSSKLGQSAIRDRTESAMNISLGPIVLNLKANMSHDCGHVVGHHPVMPSFQSSTEYKADFIARTKQARQATGMTQDELAGLLGIKQDRYKQYETRSMLPHEYVERFCLACTVTTEWLFTGKGRAPRARSRTAA
jgi:DNA-binding XRE family transcriptional regulator